MRRYWFLWWYIFVCIYFLSGCTWFHENVATYGGYVEKDKRDWWMVDPVALAAENRRSLEGWSRTLQDVEESVGRPALVLALDKKQTLVIWKTYSVGEPYYGVMFYGGRWAYQLENPTADPEIDIALKAAEYSLLMDGDSSHPGCGTIRPL